MVSKTNICKTLYILCLIVVSLGFIGKFTTGRFSLFGFRPFYVATGSMEPLIPSHSLVLTRVVDSNHVSVGDIVIYKRMILSHNHHTPSYLLIVHRIIGITDDDGYILKGDANQNADDTIVYTDQILYTVIWHM